MKAKEILAAILAKVKDALQKHSDQLEQSLSLENAENVVTILQSVVLEAAYKSMVAW